MKSRYLLLIIIFISVSFCYAQDPDSHEAKSMVTVQHDSLRAIAASSEMILIQGGDYDGEKIESFYMDATLITVEQYKACVEAGVCPPPPKNNYWSDTYTQDNGKLPINNISWYNARTFAEWVGKRLPTEKEWEWAARGRDKGWRYPWGNDLPNNESACWMRWNSESDSGGGTCEVGKFAVSRDGVKDMAGNLWEWTSTFFDKEKKLVILKGGAWYNDDPKKLAVKYQGVASPYHRADSSDGFRCVKSAKEKR